jgi:hypothetical protein
VTGSPAAAAFAPTIAVSELAVGDNRFALGIVDQQSNRPVADARVTLRFYTLQGNQGTLRSESEARFIAPARDAGLAGVIEHRHADGEKHLHDNVDVDTGVYIAQTRFDQPGRWAVEALFRTTDGREGKVTAPFEVLAAPVTPAVGAPAPRTRNLTARDVSDLSEIDTSANPSPELHQTTVADAIAAGRPALVAFVTPGYCSSRFCGPSLEIVRKLQPKYGAKADLIHLEIYKDPIKRTPTDAVVEWKLRSEPYFFVIDRQGNIAAKFEGPTSLAELDAALARVTG